jgi:hypothetical protein
MSAGYIESRGDVQTRGSPQADAAGSDVEPEPVEMPPEADEASENATFHSVHRLNHHASRLVAALYSLSKRLQGTEFDFILTKQAADLAKGKLATDPRLASFFTEELVAEWGRRPRDAFPAARASASAAAFEGVLGP